MPGLTRRELTWELTWVLEALDEIWALCSAHLQFYSSTTTWDPATPSRAAGQQGQSLTRQIGIVVPG